MTEPKRPDLDYLLILSDDITGCIEDGSPACVCPACQFNQQCRRAWEWIHHLEAKLKAIGELPVRRVRHVENKPTGDPTAHLRVSIVHELEQWDAVKQGDIQAILEDKDEKTR